MSHKFYKAAKKKLYFILQKKQISMPDNYLKIISLNIEQDKHLLNIIPFLQQQKSDVILLQEVFLDNLSFFEKELGMKGIFSVMKILTYKDRQRPWGIATFSALPMAKNFRTYYYGAHKIPPIGPEGDPLKIARCILLTEFLKENKSYCFANTHFTWTPDGQDSPQQHKDLKDLFQLLSQLSEFILCGDFNAPRGRIIFDKIASKYKDNIPSHITTTIDKNLHRTGDLQLVVDGLFSTPQYQVESVEIFDGLSDHCAILAKIF